MVKVGGAKRRTEEPEEREGKKYKKSKFKKEPKEDSNSDAEDIPTTSTKGAVEEITWPTKDLFELAKRIKAVLPSNDTLTFKSRAEKLMWDKICFADYTAEECKRVWNMCQSRVRRFRTLSEIVEDVEEWIHKPWTNFYRGVKNNRHPEMPKRPLSSYMLYYMQKKDKVLKTNSGMEMTDLSKKIAEMYKNESRSVKEKYNNLAAIRRREYEAKLEEFYKNHPEVATLFRNNIDKNQKVSTCSLNGLIKPSSPFKLFCDDKLKREKDEPDFEKNSIIEQCKAMWKAMSDKKKVIWIDWAIEEENKYLEKLHIYCSENPDFVAPPYKSVLTKEERTIKDRMAGKPIKPPNSGYSYFSRMMLRDDRLKDVDPKNRMQVISQEWKNLPESDKKEYQDQSRHLLDQYKLDFANYLESLPDDKKKEELEKLQPKRKVISKKQKPEETVESKELVKKSQQSESVVNNTENDELVFEGEPTPPPINSYLFFKQSLDANKRKYAPVFWKRMAPEKKRPFRVELYKLKREYIANYEKFLKSLTSLQLQAYSKVAPEKDKKYHDKSLKDVEEISLSSSDDDYELNSDSSSD